MRPRRAPLPFLERAYFPKTRRPRWVPPLLVALVWIVSALLTAGFAWLVGSNLAIALAAVPFCRVCEAGSFERLYEVLPRPTSLSDLDVEVAMCPKHLAQAEQAIRDFERAHVREQRVH